VESRYIDYALSTHEYSSLAGCYVISTGKYSPKFRRIVVPSYRVMQTTTLKVKAIPSSEKSVTVYMSTWRNFPKGLNFDHTATDNYAWCGQVGKPREKTQNQNKRLAVGHHTRDRKIKFIILTVIRRQRVSKIELLQNDSHNCTALYSVKSPIII
jgi:hypothetical protein